MKKRKTPAWPKSELVRIDPKLPMQERVELYRQNVRTIRAAGCKVPSVMPDTLDGEAIATWFAANDEQIRRLKSAIRKLARLLPEGTEIPTTMANKELRQ